MLRKIISGGQTGADRAGLDFAIETGLEHGGYVPRGRKAEDGRIDDRYNMVELSTTSYPARTRRNIKESDGTVIFSLERLLSGGTKLTWEHANKLGKPVLHIYDTRKEGILAHLSQLAGSAARGTAPGLHRGQKVCTTRAMLVCSRATFR